MNRIILLLILLVITNQLFSQSDYDLVKNFKQKYNQLEEAITKAKNLEELNSIVADIDRFRNEYLEQKALLDKSLYPGNFDKTFERLNISFVIRNQNFTTIDILQTENLELKEQVTLLNKRNAELMNKIQEYEYTDKKDVNKAAELDALVKELRRSLRKRDELIVSIVDSLLPMMEQTQLSSQEMNSIYIEAERNNVLSNVKHSLLDNIRFIELTSLEPGDLTEIKKQQNKFVEFWQGAGTKLVDIYAGKNKKNKEIKEIDSLFSIWNFTLEQEAWRNIREEFAYNNINLIEFTNSEEFANVLTSFIDEAIKNIGVKSPAESNLTYSSFSDSTWFKVISPNWIPFLIDNKMLDAYQERNVEIKISDWKGRLTPSSFGWMYVLVAVIAVAGLGYMNRKRIFKKQ
ncbi:MAG: hypothetical protein E2O46_01375 [Ignavibacteria bacterium]|nr:MAG: hypothetical protein E2O46_01375 [Ignavibacteria bacterium]